MTTKHLELINDERTNERVKKLPRKQFFRSWDFNCSQPNSIVFLILWISKMRSKWHDNQFCIKHEIRMKKLSKFKLPRKDLKSSSFSILFRLNSRESSGFRIDTFTFTLKMYTTPKSRTMTLPLYLQQSNNDKDGVQFVAFFPFIPSLQMVHFYAVLNNFSSRWHKSVFSHLKWFAWVQIVTLSHQKKAQNKRQVQMKLGW